MPGTWNRVNHSGDPQRQVAKIPAPSAPLGGWPTFRSARAGFEMSPFWCSRSIVSQSNVFQTRQPSCKEPENCKNSIIDLLLVQFHGNLLLMFAGARSARNTDAEGEKKASLRSADSRGGCPSMAYASSAFPAQSPPAPLYPPSFVSPSRACPTIACLWPVPVQLSLCRS